MGTPILPPIDTGPVPAGDLCSTCWGIGNTFGNNKTPSSVIATFFGVEKGPGWVVGMGEPLDGDYALVQRPTIPCAFRFLSSPSYIYWNCTGANAEMFGVNSEGYTVFCGGAGLCGLLALNTQTYRFKNGSCLITIPEIEE